MWALLKATCTTSGDPLSGGSACPPARAGLLVLDILLWNGWFRIRVRQEVAGMVPYCCWRKATEQSGCGGRRRAAATGAVKRAASNAHKRTPLPVFCNTN